MTSSGDTLSYIIAFGKGPQASVVYFSYMNPIFRIILGLIVMVVGFLMVMRTSVVLKWFGRIPFAEQKLGSGGTHTFYKLLGILIVFIGIFIVTNIISGILDSFAGLFIRG